MPLGSLEAEPSRVMSAPWSLMLVAHTPADLVRYRPVAQEVAHFCERWGMQYEERLGSDGYVRQLVEIARALSDGCKSPNGFGRDFLVISPGGEIRQDQFIR